MSTATWLLTINGLSPAGVLKTWHFCDEYYADAADNRWYKRLNNPGLVMVSPNDGGVLRIFSAASVGELELNNNDSGIDDFVNYAIDGQDVQLSLFNGSAVIPYFSGTCSVPRESDGKIFVPLLTLKDTLDTDHPQTVYGGTNVLPNGVDGLPTDIKGTVQPRTYGKVLNQTPKVVNTSKLIGHVSSRSTTVIDAVYDRGNAFIKDPDYADLAALQATAPAAGRVRCFRGYYRLGSAPTGTVTVDSRDTSNLAGAVFKAICDERGIATDAASITLLNTIGEVGMLVDSTTSTTDMLNTLIKGLGAHWFFVGNTIYARKLALATVSTFELMPHHIVSIDRQARGLGQNGAPVASVKIQCDKVETVQNDLNGTAVPADRVARLSEQWRKTESNSSIAPARHKLAKSIELDSCLRSISDAKAVGDSMLNVLQNDCDWVTVDAAISALPALSIGAGFTVYWDQLGYSAGKLLTIIGFQPDPKYSSVKIEAIG